MKKMKINYILKGLFVFFLGINWVLGQGTTPTQADIKHLAPKVVPPSPEAASLGKFGNTPVGYFNGTPQVNIPLYSASSKGINVPISLSYHAGGIRVEEIASRVGLGWTLNTGGSITRSVMGKPDESSNGWLDYQPANTIPPVVAGDFCGLLFKYAYDQSRSIVDGEPDIFNFNFLGKSGQFILDRSGNPIITPYQKIKVEYLRPSTAQFIWKITDENGLVYTFEAEETQTSGTLCQAGGNSTYNLTTFAAVNSWFLTKIESPEKGLVTFSYDILPIEYRNMLSETKYILGARLPNTIGSPPPVFTARTNQQCLTYNNINAKVIKKIEFENGSVEFLADLNRKDLKGDKAISKISIKDASGNMVKGFSFSYTGTYTGTFSSTREDDILGWNYIDGKYENERLYLDNIQEFGISETNLLPAHEFTYFKDSHNNTLPNRMSKARDYWGFYNGMQNTTLVPEYLYYGSNPGNQGIIKSPGGDRYPVIDYCKTGTLNKIVYPTGGSTEFDFELPDYNGTTVIQKPVFQNAPPLDICFSSPCTPNAQNPIETAPFTITDEVLATFSGLELPCVNPNDPNPNICQIGFTIKILKQKDDGTWDINTSTPFFKINYRAANGSIPVTLVSGVYKLRYEPGQLTSPPFPTVPFRLSWFRWNATPAPKAVIGGLRIKRIKDFDNLNSLTTYKFLKYESDGVSSGKLANTESGVSTNLILDDYSCGSWVASSVTNSYTLYNVLKSESSGFLSPLPGTGSNTIGYSEVTEYISSDAILGSNVNGKTVYEYSNTPDVVLGGSAIYQNQGLFFARSDKSDEFEVTRYGNIPLIWGSNAWQRGLMTKTSHYRKFPSSSTYNLLSEKIFEYDIISPIISPVVIMKAVSIASSNFLIGCSDNTGLAAYGPCPVAHVGGNPALTSFRLYRNYIGYSQLKSTNERSYILP